MNHPAAYFTVFVVSIASALSAHGQTRQVVVLRNGNVLQGEVDLLGDVYRVMTNTSEIRLPATEVERVVATLHDAYAARRAEVRSDVAVDRLRLATWCIRQEMWAEAANELAEVRSIAPRHPDLPLLERRIEVLSRAAMRATRQHEAEMAAAVVPQVAAKDDTKELESLVASLPPGTLESFARHVQPILVNGCAAGGCHSSSDPRQFQLNRDLVRGVANRESTLRNLKAAWNAIDHRHPNRSPLLLQPSVPHGGLPRPVFAGHRTKVHERLVEWVRQATGALPSTQPEVPMTNDVNLAHYEQSPAPGPRRNGCCRLAPWRSPLLGGSCGDGFGSGGTAAAAWRASPIRSDSQAVSAPGRIRSRAVQSAPAAELRRDRVACVANDLAFAVVSDPRVTALRGRTPRGPSCYSTRVS